MMPTMSRKQKSFQSARTRCPCRAEEERGGDRRGASRGGARAYFAGGCVRDMVMGIEPHDYDIATSARPEEVVRLFPGSLTVGAQFGVVVVTSESLSRLSRLPVSRLPSLTPPVSPSFFEVALSRGRTVKRWPPSG